MEPIVTDILSPSMADVAAAIGGVAHIRGANTGNLTVSGQFSATTSSECACSPCAMHSLHLLSNCPKTKQRPVADNRGDSHYNNISKPLTYTRGCYTEVVSSVQAALELYICNADYTIDYPRV